MKQKSYSVPVRAVAFLCLFVLAFACVTKIFQRKSLGGEWNYTVKVGSFLNLEEDSVDVIAFGSSHAYCSVVPRVLQEKYGLSAYVLATQQQPVSASYYYMKEALKTQSPKVMIFETYMAQCAGYELTDAVIYDAIDQLPLSLNKLEMIHTLTEEKEDTLPFYFTLLKYHSRWSELGISDFTHQRRNDFDENRGYVCLKDSKPQKFHEIKNPEAVGTINKTDLEYLNKMTELAKENDIKLVFLYAPFPMSDKYVPDVNAMEAFAAEKGIPFINGWKNFEDFGLDLSKDFYDGGHLNLSGAEKCTDYLGKYLAGIV